MYNQTYVLMTSLTTMLIDFYTDFLHRLDACHDSLCLPRQIYRHETYKLICTASMIDVGDNNNRRDAQWLTQV